VQISETFGQWLASVPLKTMAFWGITEDRSESAQIYTANSRHRLKKDAESLHKHAIT
jgi:hypothetical protein